MFAEYAFPPMMPNSASHADAWEDDQCLSCHESDDKEGTIVEHEGMPKILLESKCRTCHVQVRAVETMEPPE